MSLYGCHRTFSHHTCLEVYIVMCSDYLLFNRHTTTNCFECICNQTMYDDMIKLRICLSHNHIGDVTLHLLASKISH